MANIPFAGNGDVTPYANTRLPVSADHVSSLSHGRKGAGFNDFDRLQTLTTCFPRGPTASHNL